MRIALSLFVAAMAGCNLTPSTARLNFGTIYVGQTVDRTVNWTNGSQQAVEVRGFATTGRTYAVTNPTSFTATQIQPNASTVNVTITFAPTDDGTFPGDTVPIVPFPASATGVQLTGVAVWQKLNGNGFGVGGGDYRQNQPLDFGTLTPGQVVTKDFRLGNTSATALTLGGRLLIGNQGFAITAPAGGTVNLPAGALANPQRVRVTVTFTAPQAAGDYLDIAEFTGTAGYKFGIVLKAKVQNPGN